MGLFLLTFLPNRYGRKRVMMLDFIGFLMLFLWLLMERHTRKYGYL